LNGALLVALGAVTFGPKVVAQTRTRGTYTMVSGTIKGQIQPVLYVVDESALELVAVSWDDNRRQMTGMGFRNLAADINDIARTRN